MFSLLLKELIFFFLFFFFSTGGCYLWILVKHGSRNLVKEQTANRNRYWLQYILEPIQSYSTSFPLHHMSATWQNQQNESVPSEDSDQPWHPPSLIRVFASAWRKLGSLATSWAQNEDSDQTGRMPRLIWVFAGRTVILLFCHVAAHIYTKDGTKYNTTNGKRKDSPFPADGHQAILNKGTESQGDSSFPADGHQAIPNKGNRKSRGQLFPSRWPPGYPKQRERKVKRTALSQLMATRLF